MRCLECGASRIIPPPPPPLPPPDTQQFRTLWKTQPSVIAEQLTDEERLDPRRNPLHPAADDEPPEWFGGRPWR